MIIEKNEKLIEARKKKDLTQWELAMSIGISSHAQICIFEKYGKLPTWRLAKRIGRVLEVDPKELWPAIEED